MAEENIAEKIKQMNEQVERILQSEMIKPPPMLRMKHISHLDLDGYGATYLSEILQKYYPDNAMQLEIKNILPNKLFTEMEETFSHIDDYDMIVITDLAINQNVIDLIRANSQGSKVHVFDHHITDIDHPEKNMVITEKSPLHPGKLTCATELYYNFIKNDRVYGLIHTKQVRDAIEYFVECVRVYDTFEFWKYRNDDPLSVDFAYFDAPRMNTLFHILERDEFKEFIFNYLINGIPGQAITSSSDKYPWVSKVLELENNKNNKYVESAIKRMVKLPFDYTIYRDKMIHNLNYTIGVIFAEKSSPVIANTTLERYPQIDICAVVSNNQVSVYTNKPNIDACRFAKIFSGGGHKEAAGFTIPYINAAVFNINHFSQIIECAGQLAPGEIEFEDIDVSDTN